jgi:two-component sensor histidine kinase
MKLFRAIHTWQRPRWFGYALAGVLFLLALGIRLALEDDLPPGFPYLTFFPAVIITTFLGGLWPGIASAVAGGIAAWYFFIPPMNSFELTGATALALAFYAFIVSVDIALIHLMNVTLEKLRVERDVTSALYDQQRTMFQELQHRVANNMMFVASLLALHKREVTADPSRAAAAFADAGLRLETMSRIHRRLYDPAAAGLPIRRYLQELAADVIEAAGPKAVLCRVEAPAVSFDLTTLVPLSLLVTEVVTNSLKHAFIEGQKGLITIAVEELTGGRYALTVSDDGRGLPLDFAPAMSRSLGFRIVQSLTAQLDGKLSYDGQGGMTTRVEFTAHGAPAGVALT